MALTFVAALLVLRDQRLAWEVVWHVHPTYTLPTAPPLTCAPAGTTLPEIYTAYHPSNMGSSVPIQPGETAILQNQQTGQYCQLRGLPSNSSQMGMFCDQPTPATATVMTYTGSGLSYQGQPLVATGQYAPLLLSNTTKVPPGPMDDNLTFPPAGGRLARRMLKLVMCA